MTEVSQGKYIIIPKSHGDLHTAIGFIINDTHTHIDAKTNVRVNDLYTRYSV